MSHAEVNYLPSFILQTVIPLILSALILTCPHPLTPLCQWKIPPALSQHSKAKPNTDYSGQSVWPPLRGSTPNHFSTLIDQRLLMYYMMGC